MDKNYDNIESCRVCESKDIKSLLFLNEQPLANSLKKRADEYENKYPLTLVFCPKCSLIQLKETVKKEILFDTYVWVTGTSSTAKNYANIFYKRAINITKITPGGLVVEIASNDGTFLKPFLEGGYNTVGIEPAKNIAKIAQESGIRTLNKYWDYKTAKDVISTCGKAKIVIARNVIPHVSELHNVIDGIRLCLAGDGVGIIEFHYGGKILQELHYDSIYHEHLCYFSIKSMRYLLNKFGLFPFHIDLSPISGGSYVIYFSKKKNKKSSKYKQLVQKEKKLSVDRLSSWKRFSAKCVEHREKSKKILQSFKDKTVVAFGASARSSTYLNFCGFSRSDIKVIIDNNKLKQGLFSAGSSIPIVSIEKGLRMKPDLLFILAWNFKDEIINECKKMGYKGNFLIPFPQKPYILGERGEKND